MASETVATEAKLRASGEQLKQQIVEIRKSIEKINTITLALVRPDYNVTVGDQVITRAELKRTMQANDRALAQIGTQVGRGVRRRQAGEIRTTKASGGITKPNVYSQELVSFLCSANLGKVDPTNPKSEDLAAVLKRSAFGKHGVATNHTIGRLVSILVTLGGYKDKTNGQNIVFPAGYLEKHLPQALAALAKAGKSTTQWTYINFGSTLSAVCMTKKAQLDDKQKELLATHADAAVALNQLCADVLLRHKDDKAPAPVVPAVLGAPTGGRQRSPAKAKN